METAHAAGLPVPTIQAVGSWRGRPTLLLSWLPGRPIAEELRRAPWRIWSLGVAFGRMQAAIQALPAPDPLAAQSGAWIGWLGSTYPELANRLKRERPANALLHLDYHLENVLTDGLRITGILDWQNTLAGPPRADIARTFTILTIDYTGHISLAERLMRSLFTRAWRSGYERQFGPLGDASLYNAWAGAVMQRDLATKRAASDLARVARWTDKQWARARAKQEET
jgi:Ser/Thr protein kinase RdoA (MazF antagonist)